MEVLDKDPSLYEALALYRKVYEDRCHIVEIRDIPRRSFGKSLATHVDILEARSFSRRKYLRKMPEVKEKDCSTC